jgi:hypothetical protein
VKGNNSWSEAMKLFWAWSIGLSCLVLGLLSGCDRTHEPYLIIYEPKDSEKISLRHDVYFTWKDYDPSEDSGNVLYIWNGEPVGHSNEGFMQIISKLSELPAGSRVLLYPNYWVIRGFPMGDDIAFFPFERQEPLLRDVALKRRLKIIWSPYDHNGDIHPQVKPVWDAWVELQREIEEYRKEKQARKYSGDVSQDGKLRMVKVLNFHGAAVCDIAFSPTNRQAFVCFNDNKLYQWNVDTKRRVRPYELDHRWKVYRVAISPDGTCAAALCGVTYDGPWQVFIVDVSKNKIAHRFEVSDRPWDFVFSNNGKLLQITPQSNVKEKVIYNLSGEMLEGDYSAEFVKPKKRIRKTPGLPKGPSPGLSYYDEHENELFRLQVKHHGDINFDITADYKYIAASTPERELIVWRTSDQKEIYRYNLVNLCYLIYDPVKNQFLIADAESKGSTYLRALRIRGQQPTAENR